MTLAISHPLPSSPPQGELPGPGMYHGVEFADYLAWRAMSKSVLEYGMTSILHLKAASDGKMQRPETDALFFGRALHARLLEPMRYRSDFAVMPSFEPEPGSTYKNYRATNEYKSRVAEWESGINGATVIYRDDSDAIEAIAKSVYAHPAVKLMRAAGGCELSMTWMHGTGIALKGRMDKFCEAFGREKIPTIIDVKSVRSLDPDKLSREVMEYGWHRQASLYIDGVKELTGDEPDFLMVAVEKTFPYAVAVRRIGDISIDIGRQQITGIIQRWVKAQETGIYPAFGSDIETLDLPEYELRKWKGLA